MKTLYTLLLCIVFTTALQAQKINYESSKWFWGMNLGATWHNTDIQSNSYNGWGLTFGRSFNFDYGHSLSFDLRGRFLAGQWYGQANEYSALGQNSNLALQPYLTGNNQYVHNFRTDVRELDFELVLHAAKLRERTGFDPFIFGGLGFTWQQNWADLTDTSGLYYDYNTMAANGPVSEQLVGTLDNIYETRLDGLSYPEWRVNWMPSLGFGLAYHRGRVSFGLEHKTTFTMADDFDGLQDQSVRLRNDWYHYTSAFIQIHFKNPEKRPNPEPRPNPAPVNPVPNPVRPTPPNPVQNCPSPEVRVLSAPQNSATETSARLEFSVAFINSVQDLTLTNSFNQSIPFNYNSFSSRVEALVNLNLGINTFTIRATTTCGTDQQTVQIFRENCQRPVVQINNTANNTVTQASYNFTANIIGQVNSDQIQIIHNGMSALGFSYNNVTGQVQRLLNLSPGNNIIQVSVTNACGTDQANTTINYQNCVAPIISVLSPSVNSTVQSSALRLRANLLHVTNRALIKLVVNGTEQSSFTFNASTGLLEYSGQLLEGINNFTITAANDCGSDIETFTVNYAACKKPTISFVNAPANGSQVNQSALNLKAQTAFLTQTQITLSLNGVTNQPFSFQNGQVSAAMNLKPGLNTILIQGKNECDRTSQTLNITFTPAPCDPPQVVYNMIPTGSTVNNPVFTYYATVVNYTPNSNIILAINGTVLSGYSNVNGSLAAELGLIEGANQITITVTNECGTFTNTYYVTYVNDGTEGQQRKPTTTKPTAPKPAAPKPTSPAKAKPAPATPAATTPAKNTPGAQKSDTLKPAPTAPKPAPKSTENKSGNGGGQ
ncbi:MAG: hypothetical protein RL164_413 [Bacteroidota bacterium]|jgi:hypothetical protein